MATENDADSRERVHSPQTPGPDATSLEATLDPPTVDAPVLDSDALDAPAIDSPTRAAHAFDVTLDRVPPDTAHHDAVPAGATMLDATPFDVALFPYIVEMILSYAPYDVLLSFRGTNKKFQKRVDRMMLDHVSGHDCGEAGIMDFDRESVPFGTVVLTKREQRRIPALFSAQPESLRYIRVLDGPSDTALQMLPREADQMLRPTWSRNKSNQDLFLRMWHAPNQVYFTHNPSSDLQTAYVLNRCVPAKLVINVGHDWCVVPRHEAATMFPQFGSGEAEGTTIHAVFIHKWEQDDIGSKRCAAFTSPNLAHIVGQLFWPHWMSNKGPITLVGFSPQCLAPARVQDTPQPPSPDEALDVFKQDIARILKEPQDGPRRLTKDEIHDFIAHIESVDHDTYRRRVGEEAWRMETVWEHDG